MVAVSSWRNKLKCASELLIKMLWTLAIVAALQQSRTTDDRSAMSRPGRPTHLGPFKWLTIKYPTFINSVLLLRYALHARFLFLPSNISWPGLQPAAMAMVRSCYAFFKT